MRFGHVRARLRTVHISHLVVILAFLVNGCRTGGYQQPPAASLLIAYPLGATEIRLVFSEPVDRATAESPTSYSTSSALRVLKVVVDPSDPKRVTLTTEPMPSWETAPPTRIYETPADEPLKIDAVHVTGVRTITGSRLAQSVSPRFIQGIPSVWQIQKPRENAFPFTSRYAGLVVSHTYNKDGGADSNVLIDALGFAFLHRETGGPFNSIKIVTTKHIPGVADASARLHEGEGLHVLWGGGIIQTVDGETRLVDSGLMEGSILPRPLKSPPPYPITAAEISQKAGKTLRAKSLQGVIVRFENVTIDSVSQPDERKLRRFVFHDSSGEKVSGVLLHTITKPVYAADKFGAMRAIVHQPRAGEYEVIVELNQHLQ